MAVVHLTESQQTLGGEVRERECSNTNSFDGVIGSNASALLSSQLDVTGCVSPRILSAWALPDPQNAEAPQQLKGTGSGVRPMAPSLPRGAHKSKWLPDSRPRFPLL